MGGDDALIAGAAKAGRKLAIGILIVPDSCERPTRKYHNTQHLVLLTEALRAAGPPAEELDVLAEAKALAELR